MTEPRYIVITPVKDEAELIGDTLSSVAGQTWRPVLWVIVDDGSADDTPVRVRQFAQQHGFVRLVRRQNSGARQPGSAVIRAFHHGYETAKGIPHDFIVKLDADLRFQSDYFERLLVKFREQPRLGIGSGVYEELDNDGRWRVVRMPPYHAAGACKVVRRQCFDEIGGFVACPGWDTVDEIRAMTLGWLTGHFAELRMKHLKPEGSAIGSIKTSLMHGEVYYRTGGGSLFFALKVLRRLFVRPYGVGGLAMLWGYLRLAAAGADRLVSTQEAEHYRRLLAARLAGRARQLLGRQLQVKA